MSVECGTPDHAGHVIVAWLVLILFSLGLPICTVLLLAAKRCRRARRHAASGRGSAITVQHSQVKVNSMAQALQFLSAEYKDGRFFWEAVLMLKKGSLVAIASLLANSGHAHQLCRWWVCWLVKASTDTGM